MGERLVLKNRNKRQSLKRVTYSKRENGSIPSVKQQKKLERDAY